MMIGVTTTIIFTKTELPLVQVPPGGQSCVQDHSCGPILTLVQ